MVRQKNKNTLLKSSHGLFDEDHGLFNGRLIELSEKPSKKKAKSGETNQRYKFSFESDVDVANGPKYELLKQKESLDYGNAFEFSGGNLDDNRKNYERTYSSIFSYDGNVDNSKFSNNFDVMSDKNQDPTRRHKGFKQKSDQAKGDLMTRLLFKIICGFSALCLLIFIPFFGWFYIRKLNPNERAVVYRLGGRQKIKGPGLVVFLPIVDDFSIINTDTKSLTLVAKPISDSNKAIIECESCEVKYKVIDPLHLVKNLKSKPKSFVETCSISALGKAIAKSEYQHLIDSSVSKFEVMRDMKYQLNIECSVYGIQVVDVIMGKFNLIQAAPKKENIMDRLKMGNGPMGGGSLAGGIADTFAKTLTGDNVNLPENTKNALGIFINSLVSMGKSMNGQDPMGMPADWASPFAMNGHNVSNGTTVNGSAATPAEQTTSKNLQDNVEYDPAGVYVLLNSVLAKSQPLLKSELARQALGKTSLEINLVEPDGVTPIKIKCKELDGDASIYLDGVLGSTGFGKLPTGMKPTCSVSMNKEDLNAALAGRLDLIDAVASNRAKLKGDLIALSKLKFLVQLQPSKKVN